MDTLPFLQKRGVCDPRLGNNFLSWAWEQSVGAAPQLRLGEAPPKAALCMVMFNPVYKVAYIKSSRTASTAVVEAMGGFCPEDARLDFAEVRPRQLRRLFGGGLCGRGDGRVLPGGRAARFCRGATPEIAAFLGGAAGCGRLRHAADTGGSRRSATSALCLLRCVCCAAFVALRWFHGVCCAAAASLRDRPMYLGNTKSLTTVLRVCVADSQRCFESVLLTHNGASSLCCWLTEPAQPGDMPRLCCLTISVSWHLAYSETGRFQARAGPAGARAASLL